MFFSCNSVYIYGICEHNVLSRIICILQIRGYLMQIDSPTTIQCFIRLYEVLSYCMQVFEFSFLSEKDSFADILISKKKKNPQNFFVQVKKTF